MDYELKLQLINGERQPGMVVVGLAQCWRKLCEFWVRRSGELSSPIKVGRWALKNTIRMVGRAMNNRSLNVSGNLS